MSLQEIRDAFSLTNHGAMTIGTDVFNAYYKLESMELYAKISIVARQLGGEREVNPLLIQRLLEIRQKMGISGRHPGLADANVGLTNNTEIDEETLVDIVRRVTEEILSHSK